MLGVGDVLSGEDQHGVTIRGFDDLAYQGGIGRLMHIDAGNFRREQRMHLTDGKGHGRVLL
jgi:hypothetical protein